MNLNKISIGEAEEITKYYHEALRKSDGIFKIELLEPYTIQDAIKSFKLLNAYRLYDKISPLEQMLKFVEEDSASIMLFLIGFTQQEPEKQKLYNSKSTVEYMTESTIRCFGDDENIKSFFQYCTQLDNSSEFWELVYSRLKILYDVNDIYLSKYFKDSIYDVPSRTKFLECLISFELALNALEKSNIDLGFEEITKAYEGLKSLKGVYKNNSTFYYYKGRIEFLGGNLNDALNSLSKSININANFGFSFYNRAMVNAKLGNKKEEHEDLIQAEKLGVK